jgi:hypothetical protein
MSAGEADLPRFMGPEHVARMNELLEGRLLDECAGFDGDLHLLYEVSGDPDGIRTWTVTAGPSGVRFGLDEQVPDPVLVVRAGYEALAAGSAAAREGRETPEHAPEFVIHDPEGFARVSAVVDAARAIATVDVRYPGNG